MVSKSPTCIPAAKVLKTSKHFSTRGPSPSKVQVAFTRLHQHQMQQLALPEWIKDLVVWFLNISISFRFVAGDISRFASRKGVTSPKKDSTWNMTSHLLHQWVGLWKSLPFLFYSSRTTWLVDCVQTETSCPTGWWNHPGQECDTSPQQDRLYVNNIRYQSNTLVKCI